MKVSNPRAAGTWSRQPNRELRPGQGAGDWYEQLSKLCRCSGSAARLRLPRLVADAHAKMLFHLKPEMSQSSSKTVKTSCHRQRTVSELEVVSLPWQG